MTDLAEDDLCLLSVLSEQPTPHVYPGQRSYEQCKRLEEHGKCRIEPDDRVVVLCLCALQLLLSF